MREINEEVVNLYFKVFVPLGSTSFRLEAEEEG